MPLNGSVFRAPEKISVNAQVGVSLTACGFLCSAKRCCFTAYHSLMMLSTALTEMIYKTECIIFFNTPQSINMASELDKIKKNSKQSTISPWIYHELSMTTMLQVVKPRRSRAILEHRDHFDFAQSAHDERPKTNMMFQRLCAK